MHLRGAALAAFSPPPSELQPALVNMNLEDDMGKKINMKAEKKKGSWAKGTWWAKEEK